MSESYQNTVEMVEGHYKPGLFNYDKSRNSKRYPFANVKSFCHSGGANSIKLNLHTGQSTNYKSVN